LGSSQPEALQLQWPNWLLMVLLLLLLLLLRLVPSTLL
jgi:hypothetical protein